MIQWKKLILSTIAALGIACFAGGTADAANINLNEKTFPDPYVYHYVQEMCEYDTAHSTYYLPEAEKAGVTNFVVTGKTFFRYGLDGGQAVDFSGMQNFSNITSVTLDLRYNIGGRVQGDWNFRADNFFQCFPKVKELVIRSYGGQKVKLTGTSKTLESVDVLLDDEDGSLECTVSAPKVKRVCINGKFAAKSKPLGKCFPNAKRLDITTANIQKVNVTGCKKLEQLQLTDTTQKAIGQINLSKNKKLKSVKITGKLRKAKIVISKKMNKKLVQKLKKQLRKLEQSSLRDEREGDIYEKRKMVFGKRIVGGRDFVWCR